MRPAWLAEIEAEHIVETHAATTGAVASVSVRSTQLLAAVERIDKEGYMLEDVSATDLREGVELTYHFSLYEAPSRITLRLMCAREHPTAPSIASIYAGADWHERECRDFFGVEFIGHPNPQPLLLAEDYAGAPPLLKSDVARKSLLDVMPQEWLEAVGLVAPKAGGES